MSPDMSSCSHMRLRLLQRATTPMKDLRPDAPKEQMRMHEQDALPLVRPP
jgi:hypothetical protein